MSSSILARRALRNHEKLRGRDDLNVVPMIDMMVILVFFLIFTAVFTRTTVLELNLPAPNSSVPDLPEGLQLEVIVRQDRIDVADASGTLLLDVARRTWSDEVLDDGVAAALLGYLVVAHFGRGRGDWPTR